MLATTAVQVPGLTGVVAIGVGNQHSVALKSDGTVWAWGYNGNGELGNGTLPNGTHLNSSVPVQVLGLSGVRAIAIGYSHNLALLSDGTVCAWGSNASGQLGNGTLTSASTPVAVTGLSSVTAISAGSSHSLAVSSDGTVWAWGVNNLGELGNGTQTNSSMPVHVSGLTNVSAIAGGDTHSVALKNDGTVWAWGSNQLGQVGNGSTTQVITAPVQVSGLTGVIAIASGKGTHSLALKSDTTVWAWGYNGYGGLGTGTTLPSQIPVQTAGVSGAVAIATGYGHSIAFIDTLAPTASPTQAPPANGAGWNNIDVVVNWNWTDNPGGTGIDPAHCTTTLLRVAKARSL